MPVASAITRVFSWRAAVAAIAAVTGVVPIVATTGHSAAQDSGPRAAVANGRALVERSQCLDCHRIGDRGSRLGPTLTDIGNLRSREELRDALVAPDQDVLPEHRSVRLVTKDGATIVGRLLNQDAFSIQLMNADEQLKSVREIEPARADDSHQGSDAILRGQAHFAGDRRRRQLPGVAA